MALLLYLLAIVPMLSDGRVQPLQGDIEKAHVVPLERSERWLTLEETRALTRNITALSDKDFEALRVGEDPHLILSKHSLPLYLEEIYRSFPWYALLLLLYGMALFLPRFILLPIALHASLLLARALILGRPPVSNMAETLLFVPWVAAIVGTFFHERRVGALSALLLLAVLQFTFKTADFETLQPVLNSSFWLTTHVLMVVGSYGAFLIASILGHVALIKGGKAGKSLLFSLYLGTVLLISGTLLGGVWAAESWGRFWDWDPKESWAFISSSVYLLLVHAYRFGKIGERGLAIGAIVGFLFISFTWYGVNYLLGVGLHSYGFGAGGALYYALFIGGESLFLLERQRNLVKLH